jgi:hypothetical protein
MDLNNNLIEINLQNSKLYLMYSAKVVGLAGLQEDDGVTIDLLYLTFLFSSLPLCRPYSRAFILSIGSLYFTLPHDSLPSSFAVLTPKLSYSLLVHFTLLYLMTLFPPLVPSLLPSFHTLYWFTLLYFTS